MHDIDTGAIVDVNPKACAPFGYTRDEFRAARPRHARLRRAAVHAAKARWRSLARAVAGEQLRIEWHSRRKDGTLRWHEVFGKRVTIGGRDRILALARDITDRKVAEEALRASEEQYRSMFNASIDGLALWNAAGEIVDINPALWRMYGYDDGEPSGAAPRQLDRARRIRPSSCSTVAGRRVAARRSARRGASDGSRARARACTASRCSTRASRTC